MLRVVSCQSGGRPHDQGGQPDHDMRLIELNSATQQSFVLPVSVSSTEENTHSQHQSWPNYVQTISNNPRAHQR